MGTLTISVILIICMYSFSDAVKGPKVTDKVI